MNGTDQLAMGQITLQMEKVAAQYGISRRALTLSLSEGDFMLNEVIVRLVRMVATVPGDEEIKAPLTWWDALKASEVRRSPIMRWWVKRHPVEYRTWRALEVIPNFPELDKYRDQIRIARFVPTYDPGWLDS